MPESPPMELPPMPPPDREEVNIYSERFDGTFDSVKWFTADQLRAYAEAAVLQEREKWTRGARISIPTDTMEQEFQSHYRRGVMAERERCALVAEGCSRCHPDDAAMIAAAIRGT